MLSEDFTLTHMTGYVQPRDEWLSQMRDGQFIYHSIEERPTEVAFGEYAAGLDAKLVADATVYGSRNTWWLRFEMSFIERNGHWIATENIVTTRQSWNLYES